MSVFKDFLQRYKNKDVVPTLEAMQKLIRTISLFYHYKGIDKMIVTFAQILHSDGA